MTDELNIRVGQIWEQLTGDLPGRRLRVVQLSGPGFYARVETVRIGQRQTPVALGRRIWMKAETLRPPRFRVAEEASGA